MSDIFKLAEQLAAKYLQAKEHWGVDKETGTSKDPVFHNGDIVRCKRNGRLAKFITYGYWDKVSMAMIEYINEDGSTPKGHLQKTRMPISELEKV